MAKEIYEVSEAYHWVMPMMGDMFKSQSSKFSFLGN